MSHAIKVILPNPAMAQLDALGVAADTRIATLASQLLQHAIAQAADRGKPASPSRPATPPVGDSRPPWLEPPGGHEQWRTMTWAAIVALHARYPRHLEHLKDKWWTDNATTEIVAALACWRQELDDAGTDPRQELAFHMQLNDYSHQLRQPSGGATKTWKPRVASAEWRAS